MNNWFATASKFVFDHTLAAFIKADSVGSIGRYMLTIEFFTMLFGYWFVAGNPPETLMNVFYATMVYVFGDKFTPVVKEKISGIKKKNTDEAKPVENADGPAV